jgi:hypothetical protein
VFHRTIPFSSDEERICVAFDLKPKAVSWKLTIYVTLWQELFCRELR